jgi:CRP-like cAMP-binding protein
VGSNRLLADLGANEWASLAPHVRHVDVERGEVLADAGDALLQVYFPTGGVLSLLGTTGSGATVELADVGCEGVATVSAVFSSRQMPYRVVAKIAGRLARIPTAIVARQVRECGELHERILASVHDVIAQISQSAICNRYHTAKQRLARWLLTTAQRAQATELALTHEFISSMVGGPRSAVTEASAELRESGAIAYSRGMLSLEDPSLLQRESCECYQAFANGAETVAVVALPGGEGLRRISD